MWLGSERPVNFIDDHLERTIKETLIHDVRTCQPLQLTCGAEQLQRSGAKQ